VLSMMSFTRGKSAFKAASRGRSTTRSFGFVGASENRTRVVLRATAAAKPSWSEGSTKVLSTPNLPSTVFTNCRVRR